MKKILYFILTIILTLSSANPIKAIESEIIQSATELLNSALSHNELFNLPDLSNKEICLSSPIKIYQKDLANNYLPIKNKEYYLIYTDDAFVAEIVVMYENNEIISTTFNTSLAQLFNEENIKNDSFILTTRNEKYAIEQVNSLEKINAPQNIIHKISAIASIGLSSSYANQPRSGRVLNIPYESQGIYNTCWAASALVVGWYYYPNKQPNLTPYQIAQEMGISGFAGGNMSDTQQALEEYFGIEAEYVPGTLGKGTIINMINQGKPIIVGYRKTVAEDPTLERSLGHMVVLAGYDVSTSSSTVKYYFRDSDSESSSYVIVRSNTFPSEYEYSGITLNWKNACYRQ